MAELSSAGGGSSAVSTPSPVPLGIANRGVDAETGAQPARSLSVSVGNSPSHLSRSPRMGRKSLRNYHQPQQQQQQPGPPLYENQSYPPLESLSLNESTRSRSGSEPSIYASRSEQAHERHESASKTSAVRFTRSHSPRHTSFILTVLSFRQFRRRSRRSCRPPSRRAKSNSPPFRLTRRQRRRSWNSCSPKWPAVE